MRLPGRSSRASVRHTDARWGYGQAKLRGRVFRVQRRSQTDRSPAWPGIDSTDSSADRPPLTGPQHINIRWKAQGLRFPRPEAQESRNGSSTDGHDRSLVFLSPFGLLSQGQLRWSPSSRDSTLLSCPQSDHDLRGDSATEYQQSRSKLAESGSIILTAHKIHSHACSPGQKVPVQGQQPPPP